MRILVVVLIFGLCGCTTVSERSSAVQVVADQNYSQQQLRVLLVNYATVAIARIDAAAESAFTASIGDHEVQERVMRWRLAAVRAHFAAVGHDDAFVAGYDLIVLAWQQRALLARPDIVARFGAAGAAMTQVGEELLVSYRELLPRFATSDASRAAINDKIQQLAKDHPLSDIDYQRSSVVPWVLQLAQVDDQSVLQVVGTLEDRAAAMQAYSTAYLNRMPDLARWQAELLIHRLRWSPEANQLREAVTRALQLGDEVDRLVVELPVALSSERDRAYARIDQLVAALDQRITRAEGFVKAERDITMDQVRELVAQLRLLITAERAAALAEARAIAAESVAGINRELPAAFAGELASELPQPVAVAVEAAAIRVVDHLILRALQLIGALLLVGGLVWLLRRRQRLG